MLTPFGQRHSTPMSSSGHFSGCIFLYSDGRSSGLIVHSVHVLIEPLSKRSGSIRKSTGVEPVVKPMLECLVSLFEADLKTGYL